MDATIATDAAAPKRFGTAHSASGRALKQPDYGDRHACLKLGFQANTKVHQIHRLPSDKLSTTVDLTAMADP